MRQVVLISGRKCNGKSKLAELLHDEFDYALIRTSDILRTLANDRGLPNDTLSLQKLGDAVDSETGSRWLFDAVLESASGLPERAPIVVDNIRTREQLEHFRRHHQWKIVHAHLYAPANELEARYAKKLVRGFGENGLTYFQADLLKDDGDILHFKRDADVRINTARTDARDTFVRVAARLGLYSPPGERCVDVLVGGQYGSEGKGHVAAYLAKDYDVLVRVGGPNAGHTVAGPLGVFTYHQLPSGARDTDAKLLLGPGMTIHVESLLQEISECRVNKERLFIDPQAMIIEQDDIVSEQELVRKIASTGRGSGAAAARRITGRKPGAIRLARDIEELKPYVGNAPPYRGSTTGQLESSYRRGQSILLEGTQGSGLSIYHGPHPYVTSRDTNVAGCLAEAGISPSRVRRILMVVRPTPIRVGDPEGGNETSGPLKHEVTFEEVARAARLDSDAVVKREITSTTKRKRRVGRFEWEQFRMACALNAPSDIVLTFADYIDAKNQSARRFEQLTEDTIKFIEELERVSQAPVSLINTRFPRESEPIDLRTVIDRRDWTTRRRATS